MKYSSHIIFALLALAPAAFAQHTPDAEQKQLPGVRGFFESFPMGATAAPGLPGAFTHPDVPPGYVLIDGDIQVRATDYAAWLVGNSTFGSVSFWNGTVPFEFAANVSPANAQLAINAMNAISARANVTFVPRTNQSDRIIFSDSTGNNSPVGRQGGPQFINIFNWDVQIVICHELFHSLGFWHEQSRPDRDTYVTIHLENVCQDCCSGHSCNGNFEIRDSASIYGPYDFDSFMHYPPGGFTVNGLDTITVNPPWNAQWQSVIGQRDHFSAFDTLTCRGIYPFPGDRWWSPGAAGNGSGSLVNPLPVGTFAGAYNAAPAGGTLFIRNSGAYRAVGVYSKAMTIVAPTGASLGP